MKRNFALIPFLFFLLNGLMAQPKSIEYEKQDFFLNVLANPNFSLCGLKDVGLNETNTSMETESTYMNASYTGNFHKYMLEAFGKDDYNTRKNAYRKIAASWRVFKEIQYRKECIHVHYSPYNTWAKDIDPVIRHKLSIVPLKLENY